MTLDVYTWGRRVVMAGAGTELALTLISSQ